MTALNDDEKHDHALGARIFVDGAEPGDHGVPLAAIVAMGSAAAGF
jgi:hypothetical protein